MYDTLKGEVTEKQISRYKNALRIKTVMMNWFTTRGNFKTIPFIFYNIIGLITKNY